MNCKVIKKAAAPSLRGWWVPTVLINVQPEGHQEPHNEVGSLGSAKHLVGFELGTFDSLSMPYPSRQPSPDTQDEEILDILEELHRSLNRLSSVVTPRLLGYFETHCPKLKLEC